MGRKVFFSFHYRDIWRVNQVRNSWRSKSDWQPVLVDVTVFENARKEGEAAIQKSIAEQLKGTSVTVVLIGAETSANKYVRYELEQSWQKRNGILGIYIHQLMDQYGETDAKGSNTFGPIFTSPKDNKKYFYERFSTYDWVDDNGFLNLNEWITNAANNVGR